MVHSHEREVEVFEAALELPPGQRDAYLEQAAGDGALLAELSLRSYHQAKMLGGPINYLAPEEAAIMESSQTTHRPGHGTDRIWELLKSEAIARTGRPKR